MIWPFNKPKRNLHEELAAAVSAKVELERKLFLARDGRGQTVAANIELARQLADACRERDEYRESAAMWKRIAARRGGVLSIIDRTVSRNGTARKLARLAREALE